MPQPERHDFLILGSGQGGKRLVWHLARLGQSVVVVERRWVGGSCPAVACLPSKNEIWSARVEHLARHAAQFGTETGAVAVDMRGQRRAGVVSMPLASGRTLHEAAGVRCGSRCISSMTQQLPSGCCII
jgi:pyruvate/2-oxoglutarate dehydrogenase complex dihydrolipoamide dehydrogenase (E3) component